MILIIDSSARGAENYEQLLIGRLGRPDTGFHRFRSLEEAADATAETPDAADAIVVLSLLPGPTGEIPAREREALARFRCGLCLICSAYFGDPVFANQVGALEGPAKVQRVDKWDLAWAARTVEILQAHLLNTRFVELYCELFPPEGGPTRVANVSTALAALSFLSKDTPQHARWVDQTLSSRVRDQLKARPLTWYSSGVPGLRLASAAGALSPKDLKPLIAEVNSAVLELRSPPFLLEEWTEAFPLEIYFVRFEQTFATDSLFLIDLQQDTGDVRAKVVLYIDRRVFDMPRRLRRYELLQHICRCALRSLCPSPDPSGLAFEEAFGAWAAERISGESLEERPVLFTGVPLDAPENRGASYALLWFLRDTAREDVVATMWRHTGRGVVDALRQAHVPLNHLLIQFLKWALNEDLLTSVQFPRDIELERRRLAHCAFWLGPAPDISGILRLNSPYQENAAALLVGTPQAPDFRLRFTPLPTGSPPWQPQHLLVFNSMPGNASIPGALTGIQWSVRCEAIEVSSAAVR